MEASSGVRWNTIVSETALLSVSSGATSTIAEKAATPALQRAKFTAAEFRQGDSFEHVVGLKGGKGRTAGDLHLLHKPSWDNSRPWLRHRL